MKTISDTMRYQLLAEQLSLKPFPLDYPPCFYEKIEKSLTRLFWYIYTHSDILYIEFIDEKILLQYVKHQKARGFQDLTFTETIKDVKNFLIFLKKVRKTPKIPKVDFSINNISLWATL